MNNADLIRRLRTSSVGHVKTSKINWNKVIRHRDDNKQLAGERESRLHAKRYSESADERDGRICAFKGVDGAGVLDIGFDNNRSNPSRQAINYNRVTHKWEHAPVVNHASKLTQLSNLVRSSTAQSINLHKGGSL
jgi:translation elongation factor EF-G